MTKPLTPDEQQVTNQAESFFSKAWRVYDFFFFRLLGYGPAVRAFLTQSVHLKSGDRVLDAGCGTGLLSKCLHRNASSAKIDDITIHAFDLTPQMLNQLEAWIEQTGAKGIETALFNVLDLDARPSNWGSYDRVVTSAMMEYLPRSSLAKALRGLGSLLVENGSLLLVITRRNFLTNLMVGKLWRSNLYSREELEQLINDAGFENIVFRDFPGRHKYFGWSVHIVEMR